MGERGSVHTHRPTYTRKDPVTGERKLYTANTWMWRFSYRGKEYRGASGYKTRTEAREAGLKRQREVVAGHEQDPRKLRWAALEQGIRDEYSLRSKHTQQVLATCLSHLRGFFGEDSYAMDITRPRIVAYVAQRRKENAAHNTIRLECAYLRLAMYLAHEQKRLLSVPRFPRLPRTVRRVFFRPDETVALLRELSPPDQRLVRAMDETSWRWKSELITRQWGHVDQGPPSWRCEGCGVTLSDDACPQCALTRPGWLVLEKGEAKNRDPRRFPLTPRLRAVMVEQRAYVDGLEQALGRIVPWVFPSETGEQMRAKHFRKRWRAACAAAGIVGKRPIDYRKTAIMRWEADGMPRSTQMAYSGHRSESVHLDYLPTDTAELRQGARFIVRSQPQPSNVVRIRPSGTDKA